MTRPDFLTQPGAWIRASRTAQAPADYACAVERSITRGESGAITWIVTGLVLVLALLVAVHYFVGA